MKVLAVTGRGGSALGSVADAELVLPGGASDAELIGKVPSRSIVLAESAVRCLILVFASTLCLRSSILLFALFFCCSYVPR